MIRAALAALLLALAALPASAAVERVVLMEKFTNTHWGSCGWAEPIFLAFLEDHPDDTVAILYHTDFPYPQDPFHAHNPADVDARLVDYTVYGVPHERLDGAFEPVYSYTYERIETVYLQRKAAPTSVSLQIGGSYDPASGAVSLSVTATTVAPLPAGDYRLHVVLTESDLYYPGPNGIDIHEHTMRRMLPGPAGAAVSFEGELPQSATAAVEFDLDPAYEPDNCRLVCFLQEAGSDEVQQAAAIPLTELPEPTAVSPSTWSAVKGLF